MVRRLGLAALVMFVSGLLAWPLGLRGWVMTWGATATEQSAVLPGDELIATAERQTTRAITIAAQPEAIFPWVTQLGAGRAGFYSHVWIERAIGCDITNGERIDAAWQAKVGDVVRLCPEGSGPPIAYVVKELTPPSAFVLAVEDQGRVATTWSFVLTPSADGTRLVSRNRTGTAQGWQEAIEPGVFVMERGMLRGIKERAERR